jgi:hypothetical protein
MTSDQSALALQRQAIAKLVADGTIKHERPGLYPDDTMSTDERERLPSYDIGEFQKAFPDILQIDFDEMVEEGTGKSLGFNARLVDGRSDPQDVFIEVLPTTTTGLIELFQAYFKGIYNIEELEKARDVFEGLE